MVMINKKILIFVVSIFLGLLIVFQVRSFAGINNIFLRDSQSNIFQEIKILKEKNEDLQKEVENLKSLLEQLDDQNLALDAIKKEIEKYMKLSGKYPVFGPGLTITIKDRLTTPWVVDSINEFFYAGAEAVSINNIRITNNSAGLDTLPQGQILLNGSILSTPYNFDIIGESSVILEILEVPGGILDKLKAKFPEATISISEKDVIRME
ncbi:DUF881 domain-containing protein [Candidatus Peregrinibacteria bacterium]|nr:DUF881 domain-containing protein [Candidatus Peregrinibacteria bacterium]